jgi:hypothetical protein
LRWNEPEQHLYIALLQGAVEDLQHADPRQRHRAEHWIAGESTAPVTLDMVCQALALDADVVRRWVRRLNMAPQRRRGIRGIVKIVGCARGNP